MGRRITFFDFVPARERKRREIEFYRRSFPFGEQQKEKEEELLCALFPGKDRTSLLYNVLTLKDALREEETREEAIAYWKKDKLTQDLTPQEQEKMIRYTFRSLATRSLEDYPDAADAQAWLDNNGAAV